MSKWKLLGIKYLSEKSDISDNSGQTAMQAKYKKRFLNLETFQINETTDLDSKIYKRNKKIDLFKLAYAQKFLKKEVTLLTAVINQDEYPSISKFINTITRKLKRHDMIEVLGYLWVRDIGDLNFKKHYHLVMATTRIDAASFKLLFQKKTHSNYDIQFVKKLNGILKYIYKKELFGKHKQRPFGKSKKFKLPSKLIITKTKKNKDEI